MDVLLEAGAGQAIPEDTFVSIRIGDVHKQTRFVASRTHRFPESCAGQSFARIEIFKRLGTAIVDFDDTSGDFLCNQPVEVPCDYPGLASISWNLSAKKQGAGSQDRQKLPIQRLNSAQRYLKENNLEAELSQVVQELLKARPKDPHAFVSSRMESMRDLRTSARSQVLPPLPKKEVSCMPELDLPAQSAKGLPPIDPGELTPAGLKSVKSAPTLETAKPEPRQTPGASRSLKKTSTMNSRSVKTQEPRPTVLPFDSYYRSYFCTAERPGDLACRLFPGSSKGSCSGKLAKTLSRPQQTVLPFAGYYGSYFVTAEPPGELAQRLFPRTAQGSTGRKAVNEVFTAAKRVAYLQQPSVGQTMLVFPGRSVTKVSRPSVLPFGAYCFWYGEPPGDLARRLFPGNAKGISSSKVTNSSKASQPTALPRAGHHGTHCCGGKPPGEIARRLFPGCAPGLSSSKVSNGVTDGGSKSSQPTALPRAGHHGTHCCGGKPPGEFAQRLFPGSAPEIPSNKVSNGVTDGGSMSSQPTALPRAGHHGTHCCGGQPTGELARRLFPTSAKTNSSGKKQPTAVLPFASYYRSYCCTAEPPGDFARRLFPGKQSPPPQQQREQSVATRCASTMVLAPSSPRNMEELDEILEEQASAACLPYLHRPSVGQTMLVFQRRAVIANDTQQVAEAGIWQESGDLVAAPGIWEDAGSSKSLEEDAVPPMLPTGWAMSPSAQPTTASSPVTGQLPLPPGSPNSEESGLRVRTGQTEILQLTAAGSPRDAQLATQLLPGPDRPPTEPQKIRVVIQRATGLRNADTLTLSDPYCILEVRGREQIVHRRFKTKVIDNDLYPVWNEKYDVDLLPGDELSFSIWDKDTGKRDDFLGVAKIPNGMFMPDGFEGFVALEESGLQWWQDEARLYLNIRLLP